MNNIQIGVAIIFISVFSWFFYYLQSLEQIGCECALDNKRIILMFCIATIIIGRIIAIFTEAPVPLEVIVSIVGVVFIVTTIQYISHLKKIKCECSESSARTAMIYYAWLVIILYVLILILLIPLVILYTKLIVDSMPNSNTTTRLPKRKVQS